MSRSFFLNCTLTFLAVGILLHGGRGAQVVVASEPLRIVATVGMIGDLVAGVVADEPDISVTTLIGAGIDPHLYKPTRDDILALQAADLVFFNGSLLEGKMGEVLQRLEKDGKHVVAMSDLIELSSSLHKEEKEGDPHFWMDVALWSSALPRVAEKVSGLRPASREHFLSNAAKMQKELHALDNYVKEVIQSIPTDRRVLVTAHDAFGYFGRAYGLEVYGIQGLSTEAEAGLHDLETLISFLVKRAVPSVFVESSVADKNVRALVEGCRAKGHILDVGGTLFSDAMGRVGTYEGTYQGMIDHNATLIAKALGGSPPLGGRLGRLARNGKDE